MIKFFTYFFLCFGISLVLNINSKVIAHIYVKPDTAKSDSLYQLSPKLHTLSHLEAISNYYNFNEYQYYHTSKHFFSISMPSINALFGLPLNLKHINNFFGSNNGDPNNLTQTDKNTIANAFNDKSGESVYMGASVHLFSLTWKPPKSSHQYIFSISDEFSAGIRIPSDMVELLINGNKINKVYDDLDIYGNLSYFRKYSLSTSYDWYGWSYSSVTKFNFGINYLQGFAFADIDTDFGRFHTAKDRRITGSFKSTSRTSFSSSYGFNYDFAPNQNQQGNIYFPSSAGHGMSFDIGFSHYFGKDEGGFMRYNFKNIGFINWTENTAKHITETQLYLDDVFDKPQRDSIEKKFKTETSPSGNILARSKMSFDVIFGFDFQVFFDLDYRLLFLLKTEAKQVNFFTMQGSVFFQYPSYPGVYLAYGIHNELSTGLNYSTSKYDFAIFSDNILGFISPDHKVFGLNFAWGIKF